MTRRHEARISPLSSALMIFGIIFLGAFPPVGVIILILAWMVQRNYRQGVLGIREEALERARQKARDQQLAAARNF